MGWRIVSTEEAQALWECGVKLRCRNSINPRGKWGEFCPRTWSPTVYSTAFDGYRVRFKVQVEGE
jgi:hypothetical protein